MMMIDDYLKMILNVVVNDKHVRSGQACVDPLNEDTSPDCICHRS